MPQLGELQLRALSHLQLCIFFCPNHVLIQQPYTSLQPPPYIRFRSSSAIHYYWLGYLKSAYQLLKVINRCLGRLRSCGVSLSVRVEWALDVKATSYAPHGDTVLPPTDERCTSSFFLTLKKSPTSFSFEPVTTDVQKTDVEVDVK